jgi:predicted acyl esterase
VSKAKPPYLQIGPYHTFNRRDARSLAPGQIAELTFDLIPTSNLFRKGHHTRIAIAGADKDHFAPLEGDAPTVQFYRDAMRTSRIVLPVIPRRAAAATASRVNGKDR